MPFPSSREAEIAHGSLSVDAEPRRGEVTKTLSVTGQQLTVYVLIDNLIIYDVLHAAIALAMVTINFFVSLFTATEARLLRVAVGSFFDFLILVINTMKEFGPPKTAK